MCKGAEKKTPPQLNFATNKHFYPTPPCLFPKLLDFLIYLFQMLQMITKYASFQRTLCSETERVVTKVPHERHPHQVTETVYKGSSKICRTVDIFKKIRSRREDKCKKVFETVKEITLQVVACFHCLLENSLLKPFLILNCSIST